MTANLVTGFSPMQDLIPQTAATTNQTSNTDFSDVLKANTSKTAPSENGKFDGKQPEEKVNEIKEEPATTDAEKAVKSEEPAKTEKVKPEEKAEETTEVKNAVVDENGNPDEEVLEAVAEIVATMITTIAEVLEVPVEEVTEAIEALGLAKEEVLDSTVIPKLAVELTEATDVSEIITDEELFADVKSLMENSDKLVNELATELDIPVEELKEVIATKVSEAKAPASYEEPVYVGKETATDFDPAPQVAYVPETSTEAYKNEDRQGTSNRENSRQNASANANDNVNYAQQAVENIRESVQDIASEMPLSYTSGTSMEEILEQVSDNLKMTMKEDMTEMEMQLHPASLGNIRIQVVARDGVITANFTTQNEQVRQALEAQVVQLKEQMNEQGIKVEAVEVTVSSHAFERNLSKEGERGQSQGEAEAKRRKTRGINLGQMDDLDEMDEEDRVTADMMARAGNTVDYLA